MRVLHPFPGLVVHSEWAERVTTGPYDAYSPDERAALSEANPYSFLNVTRSMEDVPEERRHDVDGLLAECAEAMDRLYDVGAYRSFEDPALFLYRLEVDRPAATARLASWASSRWWATWTIGSSVTRRFGPTGPS